MSNTIDNTSNKGGHKALYEELNRRYGRKMASEIMENVIRGLSDDQIPDYMPVKALSEMVELFRGEARVALQKLKDSRECEFEEDSNVEDLEKRKLEMEFRHVYRLYWISMKLFYPLYERAMAGYSQKIDRYGCSAETTSQAMAA